MLKLVDIKKDYVVADTTVRALRGLNLCFRKNEFVSILGPSGCGKTTLLNIIGGLDHCTSGDLSIFGKSTKEYTDRDWDVYRNHRVGFIFQSYNLIPHQSVLGNVELALTIAGISKEERVARAKAALDKVGLSDQYYKKPNQLSGGQCQRVAIARSLVNDPEILLADEPTGALDTVTSKQIMDLIQEIAKERLVIMVTHNPELAEEYSTRIIKLLDGNLLDDSNPFSEEEERKQTEVYNSQKASEEVEGLKTDSDQTQGSKKPSKEQAKMTFFTAFKLSLQNLFTKKKRTTMTAIAGSIGIIGVSLVLSVSIGLQGFIGTMQNEMLTGFPIEITQSAFDINALMESDTMSFGEQKEIVKSGNWVDVESMIKRLNEMFSQMEGFQVDNDIGKAYVSYLKAMPEEYWKAIYFNYGLDVSNSIYASFSYPTKPEGRSTSISGIQAMYSNVLQQINGFETFAPYLSMLDSSFIQAPDTRIAATEDYVKSQYNILWANPSLNTNGIAKAKNEVMIVLNKDRSIADLTLGQIGYYGQEEFVNIVYKAIEDKKIEDGEITEYENYNPALYDGGQIDYSALGNLTFNWYDNNTIFSAGSGDTPFKYTPYADSFTGGEKLVVVGIIEPKEDLNYGMLSSGFYYTTALAEHIIEKNWDSNIARYLRNTEKAESFQGAAMIIKDGTVLTYQDDGTSTSFEQAMVAKFTYEALQPGSTSALATDADGNYYFTIVKDILFVPPNSGKVIPYDYDYIYGDMTAVKIGVGLVDSSNMMSSLLGSMLGGSGTSIVTFSITNLGGNVASTIVKDDGGKITSWDVDVDDDGGVYALPNRIAIYPPNFAQKDNVLMYLDTWNEENPDNEVVYSDMLSLIMNMISGLLRMITIALVGFTSLSLLVSSVMIGIITYISVVERIKEIGVIRSLGGRKRDVSNLFIAETFIIGFISGMIGILFTYLASFILNIAVAAAGIAAIADFPIFVAFIMLGVSIILTLVSGLMPAASAAKKDPVVALRSE